MQKLDNFFGSFLVSISKYLQSEDSRVYSSFLSSGELSTSISLSGIFFSSCPFFGGDGVQSIHLKQEIIEFVVMVRYEISNFKFSKKKRFKNQTLFL